MLLSCLTQLYDAYVDTYREADGSLPVMMQLKRTHTAFVVKNAELIADGEGFTPEEREVALAAALLHDTGRYEQLRRFNTFRDSDSVDHAVFSHDIVKSLGWLDQVSGEAREVILKAVLYHNRRDLPPEIEQSNQSNTSRRSLPHRPGCGQAGHLPRARGPGCAYRLEERFAGVLESCGLGAAESGRSRQHRARRAGRLPEHQVAIRLRAHSGRLDDLRPPLRDHAPPLPRTQPPRFPS